jgi:hypothetical protein
LQQDKLALAGIDDELRKATERRDHAIGTIGNLTMITQSLNSSAQNSAWAKKRSLLEFSLLPINNRLIKCDTWDEHAIDQRAHDLFELALKLWPGPRSHEGSQRKLWDERSIVKAG